MRFIKYLFLKFFFPHSRWFWTLLFLGFVFYEACGLYFQYVLKLNPCIECVYERAIFAVYAIAAFIGFLAPRFFLFRFVASGIWAVSSWYGLQIALEHRQFELTKDDPFATTCGLKANFPDYLKLDEWLPQVFAPTGICGDAVWSFMGYTMVQWIILIYICNLAVGGLFALLSFVPFRVYKASWLCEPLAVQYTVKKDPASDYYKMMQKQRRK